MTDEEPDEEFVERLRTWVDEELERKAKLPPRPKMCCDCRFWLWAMPIDDGPSPEDAIGTCSTDKADAHGSNSCAFHENRGEHLLYRTDEDIKRENTRH